jgi:hypothetical protein
MSIKLVTFSDGSYAFRAAGRRLVNQADSSGWFDHPSEHWTLETLRIKMPDFFQKHQKFIEMNPKGFGFWIWQPAILSYLLEHLEDDEMILLLDAGCQLNSNKESKLRFQKYIEICKKSGLLLTQLADSSIYGENSTDAALTKLSVLNLLDPLSVFRNTNQIQSGIVFAVKSEESQRIVKKWLDYCVVSEYSLLIDPTSSDSQLDEFRGHRHGQSILSLIAKSEGIIPLKDETWFAPDWTAGLRFPIWAMRNRTGADAFRRNSSDILKLFIAKVERRILSYYREKF